MRIGLIGLGRIGAFHARTLSALPVVESLVVTDAVPATIAAVAEQNCLTPLEAELALTGTTHARLGRMVARHWHLPETYHEVIGGHHDASPGSRDALLCGVVQVADTLAHVLELGGPALSRVPSPPRETWEALRLSPEQTPELLDTTLAEFQQALEEFPLFPGDARSAAREPNAVAAAPGPS